MTGFSEDELFNDDAEARRNRYIDARQWIETALRRNAAHDWLGEHGVVMLLCKRLGEVMCE